MLRGRLVATLRGVRDARAFAKKATPTETKARKVSGYMLFLKDASAKLRSSGLPVSEISRQTAKQWAEVSAVQRQKYIDEATRLNELNKAPPKAVEKEVKKERAKRPTNVYADFMKSVFPAVQRQHPDKTFVEKSKIVSSMWKNLSDEEKAARKEKLMSKM